MLLKADCRRKWQPTAVFLPGESHGQRSLAGYSPWSHKRVRQDLAAKQELKVWTNISRQQCGYILKDKCGNFQNEMHRMLFVLICHPCLLVGTMSLHVFCPLCTWIVSLLTVESESEVAQSCLTLCDPVDCSPPGSSVHGILQARILEWVAISFSRGSFQPMVREHKLKKGNRLICHSQAGGG